MTDHPKKIPAAKGGEKIAAPNRSAAGLEKARNRAPKPGKPCSNRA